MSYSNGVSFVGVIVFSKMGRKVDFLGTELYSSFGIVDFGIYKLS